MAQTIYDILTDEIPRFAIYTQGRRIAYINGYGWAIITRLDGVHLYRTGDYGQTWVEKGTIITHTTALTTISVHIHAVPDSDLFYWAAHIYKGSGIHNIYVGRVILTDPDNPIISSITNVSDQTTTTGCHDPHITLTGANYFFLSYQTTRAGGSPYHQYYTLMSNNYTNWIGTTELNIGNSGTSNGRILIERRRGLNGLCMVSLNGGNVKYRYNDVGNSNLNGDWTAESNIETVIIIEAGTSWLLYKQFSLASRSDGTMYCAVIDNIANHVNVFSTSTFSGTWATITSFAGTQRYYISLSIVDKGFLEDELMIFSCTSSLSYVWAYSLMDGVFNEQQIGSTGDVLYSISSPEFISMLNKAAIPLFSEKSIGMSVLSGTWTSDVREALGVTSWGNLTIQNEQFPDSGHGAGQTYYVETRTGPANPPSGAWTAATETAPYTYTINSVVNNYIQIRITYSTDPTLHDSLIPVTSVDDISPLPIEIQYMTGVGKVEPVALMWYMRYAIPRYETY